jgi:hypothetical protein
VPTDEERAGYSRAAGRLVCLYFWLNAAAAGAIVLYVWFLCLISSRDGLPPNSTTGLRTQATLSSATAWYTAQPIALGWAAGVGSLTVVALCLLIALGRPRRSAIVHIGAGVAVWIGLLTGAAVGYVAGERAATDLILRTSVSAAAGLESGSTAKSQ